MSESSSGSGFTYRAFISYSHRDKAWADWLHKALETYRVPSRLVGTQTAHGTIPRRLNPVFRDREELASATDLGRKVNEALAKSENLIVICSPASATSRWVNEEVLNYRRMGCSERIFCLIVDGEPDATDLPGREAEECFCPALRFATEANGQPTTERSEPIAADAREGKDGKANAKLKLIAGMLGVGFDALKQREQQRRARRMAIVTTLAVAVMAVTSALAVYALISRHDAVIAQHKAQVAEHHAVTAKQAAERRQKQAEDLVNFMLGDLSDKLVAESRLDTLKDVDNKAMAYFKSLSETDVTDQALEQRARTLHQIGYVRFESGDMAGASDAYRAALKIASRLDRKEPSNTAWQRERGLILYDLSVAIGNEGNLAGSIRTGSASRSVLQDALAHSRGNRELEYRLGQADRNLGIDLEQSGRMDDAADVFNEELRLERKLVAEKPANIDYQRRLGRAYQDLGKLALLDGNLVQTVVDMRAYDAIETRASHADPNYNFLRLNVVLARGNHAVALMLAGHTEDAMRALREATDLNTQLAAADPGNARYQIFGPYFSIYRARLQRTAGNPAPAKETIRLALAAFQDLVKKDPTNIELRLFQAMAQLEQAAQLRNTGQPGTARIEARDVLHTLEPMLAKSPDDRDILRSTVSAQLLAASLEHDAATATALRNQALQNLQAVQGTKSDPRLLALRVKALLALGRSATAKSLIKRLWNDGYRDPEFVSVLQHAHIDYPANPAFAAKLLAAMKQAADDGDGAAARADPAK